jgi:hypothetical protein
LQERFNHKKTFQMKKFFFAFMLLAVAAVVSHAQAPAAKKPAASTTTKAAGPKMAFENETIDYGAIKQGADPFRVFKFKNEGSEPLVITGARGSCGCTVPTYPQEPILPGKTAEIKVRYDTQRIGPFTKTVTITTNEAGESATHILTIKGDVKQAEEKDAVPTKESGIFNNN